MAKSKIIKQLANNEITLEVALSRLMVIASDINNDALSAWAEMELNGYTEFSSLPSYRKIVSNNISYSGLKGVLKIKHASLPITAFTQETRNIINPIGIFDSVKALQEIIDDGQMRGRHLTEFQYEIYERTGIQCLEIIQEIPKDAFDGVLSNIRSKLLKIFIALDKEFGNLDDMDLDSSSISTDELEKFNERIVCLIDNSVRIGNNNRLDKTTFKTGDEDNG